MASCDGCLISDKGRHEALINARAAAKKMAGDIQKPVAIVFEGNEFVLYEAFYAFDSGMFSNVKEVVSHL